MLHYYQLLMLFILIRAHYSFFKDVYRAISWSVLYPMFTRNTVSPRLRPSNFSLSLEHYWWKTNLSIASWGYAIFTCSFTIHLRPTIIEFCCTTARDCVPGLTRNCNPWARVQIWLKRISNLWAWPNIISRCQIAIPLRTIMGHLRWISFSWIWTSTYNPHM